MKDYAQYSSRIPSPSKRYSPNHKTTQAKTTRNVTSHPLSYGGNNSSNNSSSSPQQEKRERESTSTASSHGTTQRQAPQDFSTGSSPARALTANDALSLRRKGSEATIGQLRSALEESTQRDTTAKGALAKSDAVILELRSSLRQVKRQLETLQQDTQQKSKAQQSASSTKVQQLQGTIHKLQHQLAVSQTSSRDEKVGELQVQLDRAHAQILTADMVRKELEDTLEAEQYTWELRVQDQDRQIAALQDECDTLQVDLNEARSQWKEAEQGWNGQVEDLQQQLTQARTRLATTQAMSNAQNGSEAMVQKIRQLETERAELQNCLDEALQELEAVDAELQTEGKPSPGGTPLDVIESMQYLMRWVHQEGPSQRTVHNLSRDPKRLLTELRQALEGWLRVINSRAGGGTATTRSAVSAAPSSVSQLQSQVQQYQVELKTREESSGELRESLKEAVALLKPLQDAVAKAEDDKQSLQDQLSIVESAAQTANAKLVKKSQQMEEMKADMVHLEQQVEEQKSIAMARGSLLASSPVTPRKTTPTKGGAGNNDDSLSKIQRAREELRRKRETEGNLQKLLKDAQSRFHNLHQQNEDVAAKNRELQGKLHQAETQLDGNPPEPSPEAQVSHLQHQLRDRESQVEMLQQALEHNGLQKMQHVDQQLEEAKKELASKEHAERVLNKSLKDALGLLKPLQMHLEEAEREKMDISKELRNLRKRFRQLQMGEGNTDDQSRSTFGGQDISIELIKMKEELEETVRQLEVENSQLHDALEDMSDSGMAEAKLRQKLVETNSRYEVTQNKLEDAHVENHALVKALKQKEMGENKQTEELKRLKHNLAQKESELHNAKAIARSALVKVEELTMNNIEQLSLSKDGSVEMNFPLPGH